MSEPFIWACATHERSKCDDNAWARRRRAADGGKGGSACNGTLRACWFPGCDPNLPTLLTGALNSVVTSPYMVAACLARRATTPGLFLSTSALW
jgi:hypothetical protein